MPRSFFQLVYVQFMEFFREPGALFWSFFFPVALAWGLGIAFNTRVEINRNAGLIVSDNSFIDSLKLLADKPKTVSDSFLTISIGDKNTGIVHYHFHNTTWENASTMLKRGSIALIVEEKKGK
jgi:hypothetical protein